jgi:hypothetical protein
MSSRQWFTGYLVYPEEFPSHQKFTESCVAGKTTIAPN